jgi:hypothetical protein
MTMGYGIGSRYLVYSIATALDGFCEYIDWP